MAFVDYEKAFDSVETNSTLNTLTGQNVHPKYVKLIHNIYSATTSTIQLHTEGCLFAKERGA